MADPRPHSAKATWWTASALLRGTALSGWNPRAPGLGGDGCLFLRRAVSLLCEKEGAGGEPHTSPVHCPQETPPDKMAPTDRTGPPHLQTLAGINIMQPRAQSTGDISWTVVPGWGLFYAAAWRADLLVSVVWSRIVLLSPCLSRASQ